MRSLGLVLGLGLLLGLPGGADAQNANGQTVPPARETFFGANGLPLSLGFVYTYAPGTTTPTTTWQNPSLTVANTNPISLDANGQAAIWGLGQYRQVVLDASGNTVWDSVTRVPGSVVGPGNGSAGATVQDRLVAWGNGTGTLLEADPQVSVVVNDLALYPGGLVLQSSFNSNYFSGYSQLAAETLFQKMSGTVADTTGSFRDAFYMEMDDSDTGIYAMSHTSYTLRVAAFGAQSNNNFQSMDKNVVAFNAYAMASTSSSPQPSFPPGVSGINADAFQMGGGIGDNEFAAHQPDTTGIQATSLAGVQGIVDANFADADSTHTAYAVLASNVGAKKVSALYGATAASGSKAIDFIDSGGVTVTGAGIRMPHSATSTEGSIIDYGTWNGAPAGGSYSWWNGATDGGQFGWTDGGIIIGRLDTAGFDLDQAALATTATGPFIFLTSMSGTPTGVPIKATAGETACVYDSSAHKVWCYDQPATAWKFVQLN